MGRGAAGGVPSFRRLCCKKRVFHPSPLLPPVSRLFFVDEVGCRNVGGMRCLPFAFRDIRNVCGYGQNRVIQDDWFG